jgi:TPR repeat protein
MNNKQFQSETMSLFDRFKKAVRESHALNVAAYTGLVAAGVPTAALFLADGWVRESAMMYGGAGQMPEMAASVKTLMADYAMTGGAVAGATFAAMLVAKAVVNIQDKLQELKDLKAGTPEQAQAKTGHRGATRIVLDDAEQKLVADHLEVVSDSLTTEQVQGLINKGARILAIAAQSGDPDAQYSLGEMLLYGVNGVEQDIDKGCLLIESAYRQGHAEATYIFAQMHLDGEGVERNFHKGFGLMELAAERGSRAAVSCIGEMYWHGTEERLRDTQADLQAAERCFEHLERLHPGLGAVELEAVREEMKRQYVASESLSVLEQRAGEGDADASYKLGKMHYFGVEAEKDTVKAEQYLSKAANCGIIKAKSLLGQMYVRGDGVERRTGTGLIMLEEAAEQDKGAAFALATFFESGDPFGVDKELAQEYVKKAASISFDHDYINISLKEYDKPRNGNANANAMEAFFGSSGYSSPSNDTQMRQGNDKSPSPMMG